MPLVVLGLQTCSVNRLYIDDLTVKENLILVLTAQGYRIKWAEECVKDKLEEKEFAFIMNRRAYMLSDEMRIDVNEIRDQFLENI